MKFHDVQTHSLGTFGHLAHYVHDVSVFLTKPRHMSFFHGWLAEESLPFKQKLDQKQPIIFPVVLLEFLLATEEFPP